MASQPALRLVEPSPPSVTPPAVPLGDVETAFRMYAPELSRYAYRLLGRREDVDDVIQDVFLAAHRGLRKIDNPHAARKWLYTVTARKSRRRLKKRALRQMVGFDDLPDPEAVLARDSGSEARAQLSLLLAALDRLSTDQRVAWCMTALEGQSLEEVAEALRCSRATAHRRVVSARAALEQELNHV